MVIDTWNTPVPGKTAIYTWKNKSKLFRKKARGWSINIEADIKKKKRELLLEFDILDVFSERNQIDDRDKNRMEEIKKELAQICRKRKLFCGSAPEIVELSMGTRIMPISTLWPTIDIGKIISPS